MTEQRFHALDACRASMMFLGIVLHSSLTYTAFTVYLSALPVDHPDHFPWHFVDGASSPLIDALYFLIHTFRMPVFFILAGFFTALVIRKRGVDSFLRTRLLRIGLPFIVVWATLMPLERWTAFLANYIAGGREAYVADHPWQGYFATIWNSTGAFWFLYYLVIFAAIAWVLVTFLSGSTWERRAVTAFKWLNHSMWRVIGVMSLITIGLHYFSYTPFLPDDQDFIPFIPLLTIYGLCYSIGWYWFYDQEKLFALGNRWGVYLLLGIPSFVAMFMLMGVFYSGEANPSVFFTLTNIAHGFTMWLMSLGIIGLFIRLASGASRFWRYASDASYFVYLIHVHVFLIVQGVLAHLDLPALVKLALCVLLSTVIAVGLYHVLARHSWIGQALNGKKYPWRSSHG